MSRPTKSIEFSFSGVVIGVDEAGCGPLAGPVIAAAVILNPYRRLPRGINDSKQLSAEQREDLYEHIVAYGHSAVGIASVEEIDRINILQARLLAMLRAIELLNVLPEMILIDGNRAPQMSHRCQTIVDGDAKCTSIAAASIVAKVTRDRHMRQLAAECPGYGWERNAGYGTPEHHRGLATLGVTTHHRRSFAPVRALLEMAMA